jgi:hypothetical protein
MRYTTNAEMLIDVNNPTTVNALKHLEEMEKAQTL